MIIGSTAVRVRYNARIPTTHVYKLLLASRSLPSAARNLTCKGSLNIRGSQLGETARRLDNWGQKYAPAPRALVPSLSFQVTRLGSKAAAQAFDISSQNSTGDSEIPVDQRRPQQSETSARSSCIPSAMTEAEAPSEPLADASPDKSAPSMIDATATASSVNEQQETPSQLLATNQESQPCNEDPSQTTTAPHTAAAAATAAPSEEEKAAACESQLQAKITHVKQLFSKFQLPDMEVFRSAPEHYRLRAEFRIWHDRKEVSHGTEAEESYYIMFERIEGQSKPKQVRVDVFPRGSKLMNQLMQILMVEVARVPVLKSKLYQANFHTTLSGEAMVTLVYRQPIPATWEEAAKQLRVALAKAPDSKQEQVTVIARSRKRKLELDCSHVTEVMALDDNSYTFRQVEGAFSQPNGDICRKMLSWGRRVTAGSGSHDLLELYCGNANFTVPLAPNFRKVIATEVSKASVETAHHNLKANGVTNAIVARMSSEEFTAAWHEKRPMRRLEGLDWSEVNLQTILVDPPRAGLDDETVQLLQCFDNVVYISCNPATLVANLTEIKDSHDIKRFAIFDQFPGTEHLECGAFLQRKRCT